MPRLGSVWIRNWLYCSQRSISIHRCARGLAMRIVQNVLSFLQKDNASITLPCGVRISTSSSRIQTSKRSSKTAPAGTSAIRARTKPWTARTKPWPSTMLQMPNAMATPRLSQNSIIIIIIELYTDGFDLCSDG